MAQVRRHRSPLLFLLMTLILSGCGNPTVTTGATYSPPFIPVKFIIDSSGTISVEGDAKIKTPFGTFGIEETIAYKLQPEESILFVIIRHKQNGSVVDTVYKIPTENARVHVVTNGKTVVEIEAHKAFINASEGTVQSIDVTDADSVTNAASSITETPRPIPTPTPAPPTPTPVPPTPTPIPLSLCTSQNGAPPNGSESTTLTINCRLPAQSVALTIVCYQAQLSQPFELRFDGPGIFSYQGTAGATSLSLKAFNTAVGSNICPAKFLVVSPTQVDGQVAQEVQRLKRLIGNNPTVTHVKVVGTDITKTLY